MRAQLELFTGKETLFDGATAYHALMDATKELDAVAAAQHPGANHHYYATFINLIYKALFNAPKGHTRGLRHRLTPAQRHKLHTVEQQAAQWIQEALARGADYHQVYYLIQAQVAALVKALGPEDLAGNADGSAQKTERATRRAPSRARQPEQLTLQLWSGGQPARRT
jgi:hypothetical protein